MVFSGEGREYNSTHNRLNIGKEYNSIHNSLSIGWLFLMGCHLSNILQTFLSGLFHSTLPHFTDI